MAITKVKRSVHPSKAARNPKKTAKPAPGSLALLEKSLPHRRFVEFPPVKGKTTEKVQLFITSGCHSLTIEFQDKTTLALDIEPGLTINAEFQQLEKGDVQLLAEWPPIRSQQ